MTRWHAAAKITAEAVPLASAQTSAHRPRWKETATIIVVSLGLLMALQFGGVIADSLQADTPWLTLLCYTGPVAVAAVAFWFVGWLIKA